MHQNNEIPLDRINVMTGKSYISAQYRNPDDDRSSTAARLLRIPIRAAQNCNHTSSACASWSCVESWSIDHDLLLNRTVGGRDIAAKLGLDPKLNMRPEGGIAKLADPRS